MTTALGSVGSRPALPGLVIRAIRADDASALRAFHRRLSPDTVRRCFFGAHPELSDAEAKRFTELPAGQQALVAIVGDQIAAVGRSIRVGDGNAAEVAFVVEDRYQGHGLGTELLVLLARLGWDDGIRRFVADTLIENSAMLNVFRQTPTAVTVTHTQRTGSVIRLNMDVCAPRWDLTTPK